VLATLNQHLINSGRILFGGLPDGVYDLLPHIEPGLIVDCGAAVGGVTAKMRAKSPKSRVIAFEPFPGNHEHFERRHRDDSMVTLFKGAVGARAGRASFFTPSTVRSPARIKSTPGASFVGRLDVDRTPDGEKVIEVDVHRLDDICDEQLRFLKIDIQGGEADALDGAGRLITEGRVDVIYIELMRNPELLIKLSELDFVLFDTEYALTPTKGGDLSGWRIVSEVILSTGQPSVRCWPEHAPAQIDAYNEWVISETEKAGRFTTDLVAVHAEFLPALLSASSAALRAAINDPGQ